jgi:DNA mismatch endonuclease (patch repair protein)
MAIRVPRYDGFAPSSSVASRIKQRNRAKSTRAELLLRRRVWRRGLRYRLHHAGLPGKPDLVFARERVVVFCDGDFWHGRRWEERRAKLARGSNARYWVAKIERNRERDWEQTRALLQGGWTVLRLWEGEVLRDPDAAAEQVRSVVLEARSHSG